MPLLFSSDVVESATVNNRSSSGQPRPKTIQVRRRGFVGQRISGVQRTVLDENEGVPVESIDASLGDDVDGATSAATGFCGQAVVDDLKFLHGLRR